MVQQELPASPPQSIFPAPGRNDLPADSPPLIIPPDLVQEIAAGHYSLRHRTNLQKQPFTLEKKLYKMQMRNIPDAIIKLKSPEKGHGHSAGTTYEQGEIIYSPERSPSPQARRVKAKPAERPGHSFIAPDDPTSDDQGSKRRHAGRESRPTSELIREYFERNGSINDEELVVSTVSLHTFPLLIDGQVGIIIENHSGRGNGGRVALRKHQPYQISGIGNTPKATETKASRGSIHPRYRSLFGQLLASTLKQHLRPRNSPPQAEHRSIEADDTMDAMDGYNSPQSPEVIRGHTRRFESFRKRTRTRDGQEGAA